MEFVNEWRKSRQNILVILILDGIALRFFKNASLMAGRRLATIAIFCIVEILQLIILAILQRPIQLILSASLVNACIVALCFYSITSAHQYALELWESTLQTASLAKGAQTRLINWLRTWANIRYQIIASIICVIVVVIYLLALKVVVNPLDAIVFGTLMALGGGQGFYWGIATPLMTSQLHKSSLNEFAHDPIYPSRSPVLLALSKMLLVFASWIAILITSVIVFTFFMQPQIELRYALVAVAIGYISSIWTFVYSQFKLSQIVRKIKENTLFEIQSEIHKIYQVITKSEKADFEHLKCLMELHDTISKRPNSLVDLSTFRAFLGSFLTPTLATLAGIAWPIIIQRLTSFIP